MSLTKTGRCRVRLGPILHDTLASRVDSLEIVIIAHLSAYFQVTCSSTFTSSLLNVLSLERRLALALRCFYFLFRSGIHL